MCDKAYVEFNEDAVTLIGSIPKDYTTVSAYKLSFKISGERTRYFGACLTCRTNQPQRHMTEDGK